MLRRHGDRYPMVSGTSMSNERGCLFFSSIVRTLNGLNGLNSWPRRVLCAASTLIILATPHPHDAARPFQRSHLGCCISPSSSAAGRLDRSCTPCTPTTHRHRRRPLLPSSHHTQRRHTLIRMNTCTHTHTHTHSLSLTHTYTLTHTHSHIHTHTYTATLGERERSRESEKERESKRVWGERERSM